MNYPDKSNSFNRSPIQPSFQQPYTPYTPSPMSQMISIPQMSQEYVDLRSQYQTYDQVQIRPGGDHINSLSFKNLQMRQSNVLPIHAVAPMPFQNCEQMDVQMFAMTVLRECQLRPDSFQKARNSLKEKLYTLRKIHKNFNHRMQELIEIAEIKQKAAEELIDQKKLCTKVLSKKGFEISGSEEKTTKENGSRSENSSAKSCISLTRKKQEPNPKNTINDVKNFENTQISEPLTRSSKKHTKEENVMILQIAPKGQLNQTPKKPGRKQNKEKFN